MHVHRLVVRTIFTALFFSPVVFSVCAQEERYMSPPEQSALDIASANNWSIGVEGTRDWRDVEVDGRVQRLEAWAVRGLLGYQPLPWLGLEAGAGSSQADLGGVEGDADFTWLLRAKANLVEIAVSSKPGMPRHILLRGSLMASYLEADSTCEAGKINWNEWRLVPSLQYIINLLRGGYQDPYEPASITLRAGPVFSFIKGSRDDFDGERVVDEHKDTGLCGGIDLLMASGLSLGAEISFFEDEDWSIMAGVGYKF
jgi:hypothetical protein